MIQISSFKNHHKELHSIIKQIAQELNLERILRKPEIVVQLIHKLFGRFFIHLKMEDFALYPPLAANPNQEVRESASCFREDMEAVKIRFKKYTTNWYNPKTIIINPAVFIKETKQLLRLLTDRINQEESEFYQLVEENQRG